MSNSEIDDNKVFILRKKVLNNHDLIELGVVTTPHETYVLRTKRENNLPYLSLGKKIVYLTDDIKDYFNLETNPMNDTNEKKDLKNINNLLEDVRCMFKSIYYSLKKIGDLLSEK